MQGRTHGAQRWGNQGPIHGSFLPELMGRALPPWPCPMAGAQQTGIPPPGWFKTLLPYPGVLLQLVLVCSLWMQGETDRISHQTLRAVLHQEAKC